MPFINLYYFFTDIPPVSTPEPRCNDFDLRLSNTSYTFEGSSFVYGGNAEVCVDGSYFAICDIGWDDRDAQFVCNSVGYGDPFFRKWINNITDAV